MRADNANTIINAEDLILVTGAAGFIGSRLIACLLMRGFRNLRCFLKHSSDSTRLEAIIREYGKDARVEMLKGNLLSSEDCLKAAKDVAVIYHLAAASGKSFPSVFMNCVVTTRNLLEATVTQGTVRRFVNTGSFAVYTNRNKARRGVLDESCPVEDQPTLRGDAYCFAKLKQDELVMEYHRNRGVPYVIVRPGVVYGPGKERIHGRIGLDTFGVFLHLGGPNAIPFTHVDNCAEALVLAGLIKGVEGEIFNVVDDNLPSSREFLRMYKQRVHRFRSIYVPHFVSYILCLLWEKYSEWSEGQLPPVHNRRSWAASWKRTSYSNEKIKQRLGWTQGVATSDGLSQFLTNCRSASHA